MIISDLSLDFLEFAGFAARGAVWFRIAIVHELPGRGGRPLKPDSDPEETGHAPRPPRRGNVSLACPGILCYF